MSIQHPSRVAVETPRGTVTSGPVVDTRPRTDTNELRWEYLVDLGSMRLWVPDHDARGHDTPR